MTSVNRGTEEPEIYEGEGDGEPLLETEWTISQLTNYFKVNKNLISILYKFVTN